MGGGEESRAARYGHDLPGRPLRPFFGDAEPVPQSQLLHKHRSKEAH